MPPGQTLAFNIFAHDRNASRTFDKVARHAAKAGNTVTEAFSKMKIGGLVAVGGAAAAATPQLIALGAAVAKAGPAVAVLAPAAFAGAAAFGTLKLATHGLSDAFGNMRDSEKFAESLKKLSPAARKFTVEIRALLPQFDSLRTAVQQRFFAGLAEQIRPVVNNLLPSLRQGLLGVAGTANSAAKQVATFLR